MQSVAPPIRFFLKCSVYLGVIGLHILLVFRQFPISTIENGNWPVKGDLARYIATAEAEQRLGGTGYDTSAMAGYTVGAWNSIGKKGYVILANIFPSTNIGYKYYTITLGLSLAVPLIYFYLACLLSRPANPLIALFVSFGIWHLDSQVAYFWGFGNLLYPSACAMLPLAYFLAWKTCFQSNPWIPSISFGILSATLFYAHTATMFALIPVVLTLLLWALTTRRSAMPAAWLLLSALIGGGLVLPWISELMATRSECVPQPHQWFQAGTKHLVFDVLSDRSFRRPFDRNFLLHFCFVAGVIGTNLARRRGQMPVFVIGAAGVWCIFVAYTFSHVSTLRSVQPYRFLVAAVLALGIPTCIAVWEAWCIFLTSSPAARRLIVALTLIISPACTAYLLDLSQPTSPAGLSQDDQAILNFIRKLPGDGRIICQPDTIGHLIPSWTGKAVLGGLNDQAFVHQRFSGINDAGLLFGRTCAEWSMDELRNYFSSYAVEYILLSTPEWVQFANSHPDTCTPIQNFGTIHLFKVNMPVNYVHVGRASIDIGRDTIRIHSDEKYVVIKIHYSSRLRPPDGVELIPVTVVPGDPVPFLGVKLSSAPAIVELKCR
jgi:hypothetical protein